jgi:peptidyl-prolyl cis-trans isomerase B (cyclophilin B)
VGTEKRERQKANRQLKLEQIAKEQAKQKTKRRGLQIGLIAGAVVLLTAVFYFFGREDKNEAQATTTTVAAAVTPSAAPVDATVAPTDPAATPGAAAECPEADGSSTKTMEFSAPQQMCIDPAKMYTAQVVTNVGEYTVEFDAAKAPTTVNNFVTLARYHYFDGISCHRAIPGFMVQCGDPTGTGSGGPGYKFEDELPEGGEYKVGSLAMANSGPNTNGSQFFVITGAQGETLPPSYSLFGQVTEGLDVVAKMDERGNPANNGVPPLEPIEIVSITITEA